MAILTLPLELIKNIPFIKQYYDLDVGYDRATIRLLLEDQGVIKDATRTEWQVGDDYFMAAREVDKTSGEVTFTSSNPKLSFESIGLSQQSFQLLVIFTNICKGGAMQGGVLSINRLALLGWMKASNIMPSGQLSNSHCIASTEPLVISHQHYWNEVTDYNVTPDRTYQQEKLIVFDDSFEIIEKDKHYYAIPREQAYSITVDDTLFDALLEKAKNFLLLPKQWDDDKLIFIYPFLDNNQFKQEFVKAVVKRADDEMYNKVIRFFHGIDPAKTIALQDAIIHYRNHSIAPQTVFASKSFWESKNVTHFSIRDKGAVEQLAKEYEAWKKTTLQEIYANKSFWESNDLQAFSSQDEKAVERLIADYKEWQRVQPKKKNA